jgi:diguanylate cyclase (GGDEF)-like protein
MTSTAATDPLPSPRPERTRAAPAHPTGAADRARSLLSHSDGVAALLEGVSALAIVSVLPVRPWSHSSLVALVVVWGLAAICGGLRATVGSRLPRWSLHIDVGIGSLLVTVATGVGRSEHVGLANLYLLVALFAILYLPLRAALAHIAAAGAAYALVLALGPSTPEPPVLEWVSVFGTVAVIGAIVVGLVSVLHLAAREDPLTGLANRRSWDERLEEELERARRTGAALSIAMIDLDGFKAVNDRDGHEAGDRLLQGLAHAWQAVVRGGGDFLARLGGDEFGLLAPTSDASGIRRLTKRLEDVSPKGASCSIGAATWDRTERAQDLLRRADQAMYETKQRRRRKTELRRG